MATCWTLGCDANDPHLVAGFCALAVCHVVMLDPEGNEFCVA
jgi:hypothetical protein